MKRAVIWIATIVIGSTGAFLLGRLGAEANPQSADPPSFVGFEPDEIDLGRQLWGTHVPVELLFVNDGTSEITIQSVKSSCDCVVIDAATLERRCVAPNDTLAIPITLDTGQYPGDKHRNVELTTMTGEKYRVSLRVSIYGSWSMTPDSLDLGEIILGDPAATDAEAVLTFASETDKLVGEPEVDVPWLTCRMAVRDENTTEILVRTSKDKLPPGVSTGHVVLRTSSAIRPDTSVYVRVKLSSAIIATPSTVFLVGEESKIVKFTDREGKPVKIANVEKSNDAILIERMQDDCGLELSANPRATNEKSSKIVIRDDLGRSAAVIISFFYVFGRMLVKSILWSALLVLTVSTAYLVGVNAVHGEDGGPCYTTSNESDGCPGVSTSCSACSGGSCSGDARVGGFTRVLNTEQQSGYMEYYELGRKCWISYSCQPLIGNACNDARICLPVVEKTGSSSSYYWTVYASGDVCGGGPR